MNTQLVFESGFTPTEIMDLVSMKPLDEEESAIKGFYLNRLNALYSKWKVETHRQKE
jgi:hypothetical protein